MEKKKEMCNRIVADRPTVFFIGYVRYARVS